MKPRHPVMVALITALVISVSVAAPSVASVASSGQGTISGRVTIPGGKGKSNIPVQVYRATGDDAQPWALVPDLELETRYDGSGSHPEVVGYYRASLAPGTYRIGFNMVGSGQTYNTDWLPEYWDDSSSLLGATDIVVTSGVDSPAHDARLAYSGGTISGTIRDVHGKPLAADVWVYTASPTYTGPEMTGSGSDPDGWSGKDGHYTVRTRGNPVWLYFGNQDGGFVGEYFDDAASYHDATILDAGPGVALTGKDVVLKPLVLRNRTRPKISSHVSTGQRIHADPGEWSSRELTFSYRWYRVSGSKATRIGGARSSTYKVTSASVGKKLRVEVTAKQSGTDPVSAESNTTAAVKRGSTTSLSGAAAQGKLALTAKVAVRGGGAASGRVHLTCASGALAVIDKTVTLKHGKATASASHVPPRTYDCEARYAGTSKIGTSSVTRTVQVKG